MYGFCCCFVWGGLSFCTLYAQAFFCCSSLSCFFFFFLNQFDHGTDSNTTGTISCSRSRRIILVMFFVVEKFIVIATLSLAV